MQSRFRWSIGDGALLFILAILSCDRAPEMEVAKKSRQELLFEAELRRGWWLGRLHCLKEIGVTAGPLHEEAERKSQYWINRYETLHGSE